MSRTFPAGCAPLLPPAAPAFFCASMGEKLKIVCSRQTWSDPFGAKQLSNTRSVSREFHFPNHLSVFLFGREKKKRRRAWLARHQIVLWLLSKKLCFLFSYFYTFVFKGEFFKMYKTAGLYNEKKRKTDGIIKNKDLPMSSQNFCKILKFSFKKRQKCENPIATSWKSHFKMEFWILVVLLCSWSCFELFLYQALQVPVQVHVFICFITFSVFQCLIFPFTFPGHLLCFASFLFLQFLSNFHFIFNFIPENGVFCTSRSSDKILRNYQNLISRFCKVVKIKFQGFAKS